MRVQQIKKINTLFIVGGLLLLLAMPGTSLAILNVEVTQGAEDALPIAVIPFSWGGAGAQAPLNFSELISADLLRSGRFNPVSEEALLARPTRAEGLDFNTWRVGGIDNLVIGSIRPAGGGKFAVQFQLFDVFKGEQLLGYSFTAVNAALRSTAHHISDLIYQQVTGQRGAFNTRIAYITAQRQTDGDVYTLQVADTDGYNPQTMLTSKHPIMSPAWSSDGTRLAYVSFEKRRPEIYIQQLVSGERQKVSAFKGLNGAPVWSPDGKKMALTLSKDGNPDIYILTLRDMSLQRLTDHWGIDTEPSWLPDSKAIIFTSNRSGKPQLYRLDLGQDRPRRITFDGDYNASPEVSKDGKQAAFVYREGSAFKIAVIDLETGVINVLTDGPLDESPSFAPNSSMILYAQGERGALAAVSTDGRFKQRLVATEGDVREPTWSPFIQ